MPLAAGWISFSWDWYNIGFLSFFGWVWVVWLLLWLGFRRRSFLGFGWVLGFGWFGLAVGFDGYPWGGRCGWCG